MNENYSDLMAEIQRLRSENERLEQEARLLKTAQNTIKSELKAEKDRYERQQRRILRERTARREAEQIMELKSLELYEANERLLKMNLELETTINQRTLELSNHVKSLERANHEIKQFTYLASHDLKTPLRAIGSLIGFIESDLEEIPTFRESLRESLDLIKVRVNRMHRLLNAILEYSNIGKDTKIYPPVSILHVLKDVLNNLHVPQGFQVVHQPPLFDLTVNPQRLYQILRHIIENAVRYHHQPESGVVHIWATFEGQTARLFIKDNGPGIASKYHERIFQIFQTLESKDKNKEGIGIGLPIVKKIVEEEMDGEIALESEEGQGAVFMLSFPQKQA